MGKKSKGLPQAEAPEKGQENGGESYKGWAPKPGGPVDRLEGRAIFTAAVKAEEAKDAAASPSAGGDAHANASLADHATLATDHAALKEKVADLDRQTKAGRHPEVAKHVLAFVVERKRRVEHILHSTTDGLLDPDLDIKKVGRLQERICVYQEDIETSERSPMEPELQAAREALSAFEKKHALLLKPIDAKNPTAVGADAGAKAETKARAEEAKASLEKPQSEGARKLEALLKPPPPSIVPADLTTETKAELTLLGFKWSGALSFDPPPTRAHVEEALVGLKLARSKKKGHAERDRIDDLRAFGWALEEKKAAAVPSPEPVGAASAV